MLVRYRRLRQGERDSGNGRYRELVGHLPTLPVQPRAYGDLGVLEQRQVGAAHGVEQQLFGTRPVPVYGGPTHAGLLRDSPRSWSRLVVTTWARASSVVMTEPIPPVTNATRPRRSAPVR
jgi:hypothetical protein